MKRPQFTDLWARTGRSYIPASKTDIRQTIKRFQREQRLKDLPDIFSQPATTKEQTWDSQ